jgi:hypothetical protein
LAAVFVAGMTVGFAQPRPDGARKGGKGGQRQVEAKMPTPLFRTEVPALEDYYAWERGGDT